VTDRSSVETITTIGAGIGGLYLLAKLGIAGFRLRLHDIDDSKLSDVGARIRYLSAR
jgi:2-polyprenyl-6-methoxyphenol hydroxylase-like FAD-dependent oxidoreductase